MIGGWTHGGPGPIMDPMTLVFAPDTTPAACDPAANTGVALPAPVTLRPPLIIVTAPYIDYCRAYTLALTGGQVVIGSGKDERAATCMALGADDGLTARELNGDHLRSKEAVLARVADLLGVKSKLVA